MSSGTAPSTGDSVRQQLEALSDQPVRVTVLDTDHRERILRLPGLLSRTTETGLVIETLRAPPELPEGTPVSVEVLSQQQVVWWHSVLGCSMTRGSPCLHLSIPDSIQTVQRRRYPRMDLSLPVRLVMGGGGNSLDARFRDLSAGGAALVLGEPLEPGEPVTLLFDLGTGLFFREIKGVVLRCAPDPAGRYLAALRFECAPEQEAALARWVAKRLDLEL